MNERIKEYLSSNDEELVNIGIELLCAHTEERATILMECGLNHLAGKLWSKIHKSPVETFSNGMTGYSSGFKYYTIDNHEREDNGVSKE